jgi:hypothetical protein
MKFINLNGKGIQLKSEAKDIAFIIVAALMASTFSFLYFLLIEKSTEQYAVWTPEDKSGKMPESGNEVLDRAA